MTIRPAIVSVLVFLATKYTSAITFAIGKKMGKKSSSVLLVHLVVKYASVVTFEICVLKEEKEKEEEEQQKQQQTR